MSEQMNTNFEPLRLAYEDRLAHAAQARAQGKRVVGYVGNTVPVELILAANCHPVRIAPVDGDLAASDRYIEEVSDPDVRRIFQLYCSGALHMLDWLIIPRSTESFHKLYLSIREAIRIGLVPESPRLWLYDIVHTQRPSSHAYGVARTRALWQALAESAGSDANEAAIGRACDLMDAQRTLLGQLHAARSQGQVRGSEALVATGAMRFMDPEAGLQALQAWLPHAQKFDGAQAQRILVRGVPLDHERVHVAVEALGGNVIAEDDDWGSRAAQPLQRPNGLDALTCVFEHYWRDVPCVRRHPASDEWFVDHLGGADVVLFNLAQPEDVYGWSYPKDRDLVQGRGMHSICLRSGSEELQQVQAQIQAQCGEGQSLAKKNQAGGQG